MTLDLVEIVRPAGVRLWFPFTYEEAGLGFNGQWWYNNPVYSGSSDLFLRFLKDDIEVARVHLDNEVVLDHYAGVPSLGPAALEIQFIEVRNGYRGSGIGPGVVSLLASRFPKRRLVAFSEEADGFWASLGWRRHVHADPEMACRNRPLFIQPPA